MRQGCAERAETDWLAHTTAEDLIEVQRQFKLPHEALVEKDSVHESPAPKADARISLELFTNLHRRLFPCAWIVRDMHDRRAVW